MDPIDRMLQGDEAPSASQAENAQKENSEQLNQAGTEEEAEFSKLSGSAQDRFREMYRRAREAENKLGTLSQNNFQQPQAPVRPADFQVKQALGQLDEAGLATKEYADKKLSDGFNQLRWEMEQSRLENRYSGENGEPKYIRDEVEDFMRNHPQYSSYMPEDVFKYKMFPDEFMNLAKNEGVRTSSRQTSVKPSKQQIRQDALTPEYIEERLKAQDGDKWYEEHLDEINKVIYNHTQQFKE